MKNDKKNEGFERGEPVQSRVKVREREREREIVMERKTKTVQLTRDNGEPL